MAGGSLFAITRTSPSRENLRARLQVFEFAPFLQQRVTATRIALFGHCQCNDAIDAKMANITSQFAPSGDNAHTVKIRQCKWPNRAAGVAALVVTIVDRDF